MIVARNCNFSQYNTDGWFPVQTNRPAVMVYYGQNDPGAIVAQSQQAIRYLRAKGFKVTTAVIPGSGHDRHPEVAMNFFRENWRSAKPTFTRSQRSGS